MEQIANLNLTAWGGAQRGATRQLHIRIFAATLIACGCFSALVASWLPLQVSLVSVFLFAGPHNWFELRYFLMRLPVRFGKSRNFFLMAFAGIGFLSLTYLALPLLYAFNFWPGDWPMVLACWNTLLLLWLATLVWLRGKQKQKRSWSWAIPVAFALCSLNWLGPELFSLAIVYLHPLVAFWFLDRHLRRTRPEWLRAYRRCLWLLPVLLAGMLWQLTRTPALADTNGLFWRITQHAGADLLPAISSRALVAVHVFLELLHYGVWLVALQLIAPLARQRLVNDQRFGVRPGAALVKLRGICNVQCVPIARHPRGFPKLVTSALALGAFLTVILWLGFSVDYATTRDLYFSVAIAHVLAEAPFLLRML